MGGVRKGGSEKVDEWNEERKEAKREISALERQIKKCVTTGNAAQKKKESASSSRGRDVN